MLPSRLTVEPVTVHLLSGFIASDSPLHNRDLLLREPGEVVDQPIDPQFDPANRSTYGTMGDFSTSNCRQIHMMANLQPCYPGISLRASLVLHIEQQESSKLVQNEQV